MSSFHIRPRFTQVSPQSMEEIQDHMRALLKDPATPCIGRVIPGYMVLRIPIEDRHFWSPQLSLSLEEHEEEGTLIRGLYGPNPTVWALFTYGYAALGIIALFIGMMGTSKLTLGKEAPILWVLPFLAGIAIVMYFIAQAGQKIGAEQTYTIHHFYEDTMGERTHIH